MPEAANAPSRSAVRGRHRFREYHVITVPNPMALPGYEAVCITGEEHACAAASGTLYTPGELTRWIAEHCATTGHALYEQTTRTLLRAEPGAWQ